MLVLSRKIGERIHIGENIIVEIVRIGPNSTRVGITAPSDVVILREEVIPQPVAQQQTAPQLVPAPQ